MSSKLRRPAGVTAAGLGVVGLALFLNGCGGSSYSSQFISCSTPQRHYDLSGKRRGRPSLVAVGRNGGTSVLYAMGKSGIAYESRTHGSTWQRLGRGLQGVPCALAALDPQRPQLMFATNGDELARSVDAGGHWTTLKLPGSARATGVAVQPGDDGIVYAWGFGGGHGGLTPGPPPGGIFRSDDAGVTWKKIGSYEPDAVAPAASASGMLLVAAETGLYVSTDAGAHWQTLGRGLPHPYANGEDNYNLAAIAPASANIAFASGSSQRQMNRGHYSGQFTFIVFRTTDGGSSWTPSLRLLDTSQIAFAPGSSSVAYVLGDQANGTYTDTTKFHLFRTDDSGRHWQKFTGEVPGQSTSVATVSRSNPNQLATLKADPVTPRILYGQTVGGRFARSLDGGRTWTFLPAPT